MISTVVEQEIETDFEALETRDQPRRDDIGPAGGLVPRVASIVVDVPTQAQFELVEPGVARGAQGGHEGFERTGVREGEGVVG